MPIQVRCKHLLNILIVGAFLLFLTPVQAHIMAAQKGTLNIVNDVGFMVLSVPVSALQGVDDNADKKMSNQELVTHLESVRQQIQAGIKISRPKQISVLQIMMIEIASAENSSSTLSEHLVVLGRFDLSSLPITQKSLSSYTSDRMVLSYALFGAKKSEQVVDFTITRKSQSQWLHLTPLQSEKEILPSSFSVFKDYVTTGAHHVLSGADHLLFLLIVLTAGLSLRSLIVVLSCFTAGHAISLGICLLYGWIIPSQIIEPAIAATIIGLALFDAWINWRKQKISRYVRLVLVFICAVIHGFGLAGALNDLTQWPMGSSTMLIALASFNIGIELGQVLLAIFVILLFYILVQKLKLVSQQKIVSFGSYTGIVMGIFWLVERL